MKVLLIDDELSNIKSLGLIIKGANHECVSFQNPLEAIAAFHAGNFDVVITDLTMPEMNGNEVLKLVKARNPRVYVILMSGYADVDNIICAMNNGAYAFLPKPLDFKNLKNILGKIEKELQIVKENENYHAMLIKECNIIKNDFNKLQRIVKKIAPVIYASCTFISI